MGRGEIKRAEAGEKGNESSWGTLGRERKRRATSAIFGPSHRPPRAPDFLISPFSQSFPRFLAVFPLKEPLGRRD